MNTVVFVNATIGFSENLILVNIKKVECYYNLLNCYKKKCNLADKLITNFKMLTSE